MIIIQNAGAKFLTLWVLSIKPVAKKGPDHWNNYLYKQVIELKIVAHIFSPQRNTINNFDDEIELICFICLLHVQ